MSFPTYSISWDSPVICQVQEEGTWTLPLNERHIRFWEQLEMWYDFYLTTIIRKTGRPSLENTVCHSPNSGYKNSYLSYALICKMYLFSSWDSQVSFYFGICLRSSISASQSGPVQTSFFGCSSSIIVSSVILIFIWRQDD